MEKVTSPDGTRIACYRSGTGPPLILVHGTGGVASRWAPLLPALEADFTVAALERRGRGESGDGGSYALEREAEDIAAVVDAAGRPAHLLGHSFGALCCLEAALLTENIRKLVLYQPPIKLPGHRVYPAEITSQLEALLETGDREAVAGMFYRGVLTAGAVENLKASPTWPARVASAHTLVREMRAVEGYAWDAGRFTSLRTPTLLLVGGESPPYAGAAARALDAVLPNSRIAVLAGQQHVAMDTAPDVFLDTVLAFLLEKE